MSLRPFAILAALIAGLAALFVLKLIGLLIKFAFAIALLVAVAVLGVTYLSLTASSDRGEPMSRMALLYPVSK
jgi:hypothetical protein